MMCCYCGKEESQDWFCPRCQEWGITREELIPTVAEQFHRIGREGRRYWGKLGGGIVFTDGEQVLLLKRTGKGDYPDHWAIPGGKAKEGEVPIDTARREAREECGSVEGQRFGHFDEKDGSHHFHTFMYAIREPFEIKLSDEHSEGKWVSLEEVDEMKLHPKFQESWPTYLRAIKKHFPEKPPNFSEWLYKKARITV